MNAVVLNRQFTRHPVSFRGRGFAIANDPIQDLEMVFGPIPEEQPGNPAAGYLTDNELARNQIRLARSIGTLLRM